MKRTVKRLLALLIGAVMLGTSACADALTEQTPSSFGWSTAFSPATTELSLPVQTATAAVSETPVTTAQTSVPETAVSTTEAIPVTTPARTPVTTTAQAPVTATAPVTTTSKPVVTSPPVTDAPQAACDYVLNQKSMVFHTPDCGSGKTIKAENRAEYVGTWEELVAKGYTPCGNCDPVPELTATDAPTATQTPVTTSAPQETYDYVLNTNSMKFHEPDCGSAKKISAENRAEFSGTRDELIAQGYEPCGNCKP